RDRRSKASCLKPSHHLVLPDTVTSLDQDGGYPLAVVKRQLHLPQIHVAVQHEFAARRFFVIQPPQPSGRSCGDEQQRDQHHPFHSSPATIITALLFHFVSHPPPSAFEKPAFGT